MGVDRCAHDRHLRPSRIEQVIEARQHRDGGGEVAVVAGQRPRIADPRQAERCARADEPVDVLQVPSAVAVDTDQRDGDRGRYSHPGVLHDVVRRFDEGDPRRKRRDRKALARGWGPAPAHAGRGSAGRGQRGPHGGDDLAVSGMRLPFGPSAARRGSGGAVLDVPAPRSGRRFPDVPALQVAVLDEPAPRKGSAWSSPRWVQAGLPGWAAAGFRRCSPGGRSRRGCAPGAPPSGPRRERARRPLSPSRPSAAGPW